MAKKMIIRTTPAISQQDGSSELDKFSSQQSLDSSLAIIFDKRDISFISNQLSKDGQTLLEKTVVEDVDGESRKSTLHSKGKIAIDVSETEHFMHIPDSPRGRSFVIANAIN